MTRKRDCQYDQFGHAAFDGGAGGGGGFTNMNMDDIFGSFGDIFGDLFGGGFGGRQKPACRSECPTARSKSADTGKNYHLKKLVLVRKKKLKFHPKLNVKLVGEAEPKQEPARSNVSDAADEDRLFRHSSHFSGIGAECYYMSGLWR